MAPARPDSVDFSTFGNVDDEVHVGIIVVIRTPWYFYVTVGHTNVFGVYFEILRCCHDGEFDRTFRPKRFVAPLPNGSDFLYSSYAYQNL
jgi:hypothetical protein